jgi:hypothetical protein
MRFDKTLIEQEGEKSKDPTDSDPRVVQAQNEISRLETQLTQKKQNLYRIKARIAQDIAKQQEREMLKKGAQQANQASKGDQTNNQQQVQ